MLFTIANDLSRLQVSASIDEADVGRVRAGLEATFRVDAFPNEVFTGTVEQVRLHPITLQNVVTYTTIIGVNNPGQRLMPGMTATVSVIVDRRDDVLRIPAAALRFRPEGFDATAAWPARTAAPGGSGSPTAGAAGGGAGAAPGGGRRRRAGADGGSPAAADASAPAGTRAGGGNRPTVVFVLDEKAEPQPVRMRPGLSDGQFVEVVEGVTEGQRRDRRGRRDARAHTPAGWRVRGRESLRAAAPSAEPRRWRRLIGSRSKNPTPSDVTPPPPGAT